ncbi:MAG: homoserine kinase [Proteobacteria bacterium]|jgi:homoserine kinase, Neisseria type|nr:MAG: homoserine kinase [Pseudomonadota bacterium]
MAVYTEVADDELARFIDRYGLGEVISCKGIAEGVENTNYLVHTTQGRFILTLYEKRVRREDLPFFLGLMEHLANAGITCPTPVRDRNGEMLNELAGRPAALVTFLDGMWIRRPRPEHCQAVGAALAKLHLAGRDFALTRENALGPKGWVELFSRFEDRADEVCPGLTDDIRRELDELLPIWPKGLPAGIIHADLFPDNVFFRGDQLSGLIDFYFACNDYFAYDIAICLNAWCFEQDYSFNITKSRALLKGYEQERVLEPSEREVLPILARGAALRFLLTRAYDWLHTSQSALVKPHNPLEYLRRLRFHRTVRSASEYGLETVA